MEINDQGSTLIVENVSDKNSDDKSESSSDDDTMIGYDET